MSYARFGSSDVYVYETRENRICCDACYLEEKRTNTAWAAIEFETAAKAISHLQEHKALGHNIGTSIEQIKARFKGEQE